MEHNFATEDTEVHRGGSKAGFPRCSSVPSVANFPVPGFRGLI